MSFGKFVLMKVDSKFFHIKLFHYTSIGWAYRVYEHIHVINTKGHRKKTALLAVIMYSWSLLLLPKCVSLQCMQSCWVKF